MALAIQAAWLFVLAMAVACVAWTVTHEEVFREPRTYCMDRSERAESLIERKFFYLFTCEYCFSHYVAAFFVAITGFQLLIPNWRGYLIGWLALVWVANFYMGMFGRLRLDVKEKRVEIKDIEQKVKRKIESPKPEAPKIELPAA